MNSERSFTSIIKVKTLFFFACLSLSIPCVFGETPYPISERRNPTQDSIERIITQEVAKLMKSTGYTVVSGAMYIGGKIHQFHYGKIGNGKTPDSNTIYEIGSITKTYTGLLLSQAVYDHKINLDDDIRSYLDDNYPNLILSGNKPITFRHLITHTSGLPPTINCNDSAQTTDEQLDCFRLFRKEDFFKQLKNVKLTNNSGKNYQYSGVGIQLTGYILEHVYKSSFHELFQKYIFSRSGEQNTFSKLKNDGNSNVSVGKNNEGAPMPIINGYYNYAGGLKSSTSAMLNYMKMYLESNDKVVKQAMDRLAGDVQYGRAYAWNTYNYDKENKMLYHNGGTFGHSSWIALYPDQKIGIFIVTNIVTADSQSKLNELSNSIISKSTNGSN
ncbi:serine hydrolase domain-containing protein [Dyadobacter subterraneus]|uniref:Beta-lactamase family protein n=1 Tax=Dyadobacter subterraneus TaxID=2773304 RepID=A0ABR9W9A2_9BACT|nr:serine hydrolase domain-containing protein [Dyadobacter subterraneus]MBE9462040.1 beta-lactamase family protein [Dyadobacter subterraneus]